MFHPEPRGFSDLHATICEALMIRTQGGGSPSRADPSMESSGPIQPTEQNAKKDAAQAGNPPSKDPLPQSFHDRPTDEEGNISIPEYQDLDMFLEAKAKERIRKLNPRQKKINTNCGYGFTIVQYQESLNDLPSIWQNFSSYTIDQTNVENSNLRDESFQSSAERSRTYYETYRSNLPSSSAKEPSANEIIWEDSDDEPLDLTLPKSLEANETSKKHDDRSPASLERMPPTNEEILKRRDVPSQNTAKYLPSNDETLERRGNLASNSAKKASTTEKTTWAEPDERPLHFTKSVQANVEISKQKDDVKSLAKSLQTNEVILVEDDNLPLHSTKKPRTDDSLKHRDNIELSSENEYQLNDKVLESPEDSSSNSLKNPDSNNETSEKHDDRSPASLARKTPTNEEILKRLDVPSQNAAKYLQSNDENSKQHIYQPQCLEQNIQTSKKHLEGEDNICPNPEKRQRIEEIPSSSNKSQINATQNPAKRPGGNDISEISSKRSRTSNEDLRDRSNFQNTAESPQINSENSESREFYLSPQSMLSLRTCSIDEILQRMRDDAKSQGSTVESRLQTETDGRLLLSSGPDKKKQCESENKYLSLPFIGYLYLDYKRRYPEVVITCDSVQEKEEGFVSIYEILLERGIDMTKTPFNPRRVNEIEKALLKYDSALTSLVVVSFPKAKELRPGLAYLFDNYCVEDPYYFLMGKLSRSFDQQEKDTVRNFKDLSEKKVLPKLPKIGDVQN